MTTAAMEWTRLDKSSWPAGPWQNEPDKIQWVDEATGLDCLIVRNHGGALCGYVGVPEGHPYHGIGYGSCTQSPPCEDYCDHRPESVLRVHGGLTFADRCNEATPEKWERWRASMHSRRDEAKQYPSGDAAQAWAETGKYVDDFDGWREYAIGRAICHVPAEGRPDNVWWLGFDCAHSGDVSPAFDFKYRSSFAGNDIYRNRRYVEEEVRHLAAQLKEVVGTHTNRTRSERMIEHELKVWPSFFRAIRSGEKRFEVRSVRDRDFGVGDTLILREWNPEDGEPPMGNGYTGSAVRSRVTYVLPGGRFGIDQWTAILGLSEPESGTHYGSAFYPAEQPVSVPAGRGPSDG